MILKRLPLDYNQLYLIVRRGSSVVSAWVPFPPRLPPLTGWGHWTPCYVRWNKYKPPGMPREGGDVACVLSGSQFPRRTSCARERMQWGACNLPGMSHIYPLVWHLRRLTTTTARVGCNSIQDARPPRKSPAVRPRDAETESLLAPRNRKNVSGKPKTYQTMLCQTYGRYSVFRVFGPILDFLSKGFVCGDTTTGRTDGREICSDAKAK